MFKDRFLIRTSKHVEHPNITTKPGDLTQKIKFIKNRMVENGLNLKFSSTFSTLNKFGNPKERNTHINMRLQSSYADLVL